MYVRTNDGLIGKIIEETCECYIVNYRNMYNILVLRNIYSYTSNNIIDLIEIDDVLAFKENVDGFKQLFILGIYDNEVLNKIKTKISNGSLRLINILPHQQFEKEAYRTDFICAPKIESSNL